MICDDVARIKTGFLRCEIDTTAPDRRFLVEPDCQWFGSDIQAVYPKAIAGRLGRRGSSCDSTLKSQSNKVVLFVCGLFNPTRR